MIGFLNMFMAFIGADYNAYDLNKLPRRHLKYLLFSASAATGIAPLW